MGRERVEFSEKWIRSPKRVPASGAAYFHDSLVPGLALRVSAFGHRSFLLIKRFPSAGRSVSMAL